MEAGKKLSLSLTVIASWDHLVFLALHLTIHIIKIVSVRTINGNKILKKVPYIEPIEEMESNAVCMTIGKE